MPLDRYSNNEVKEHEHEKHNPNNHPQHPHQAAHPGLALIYEDDHQNHGSARG